MSKDYQMTLVPKEFHRKVKSEAAKNGMTMKGYLKKIAEQDISVAEYFKQEKRKGKGGFRFEI